MVGRKYGSVSWSTYWRQCSNWCRKCCDKRYSDWSIAVGNPCRVIRKITDEDKRTLFHNEEIDEEAWNMICAQEKA